MLSYCVLRKIRGVNFKWNLVKRQAGHSKWHNIRHTKAAKDEERSVVINRKLRNIRLVLSDNGWVTDPAKCPALQRAIDEALSANVPKETVENYFKKVQKVQENPIEYRLRGPNDCIINISYSCSVANENELRQKVKKLLAKSSTLRVTPGFHKAFEKKGVIVARHLVKESSMDDAEEAAIIGGAEEVRPEEENNMYSFLTESNSLWSVTKYLRSNNWQVIDAGTEELPTYLVELSETELQELLEDLKKFQDLPEFLKMVDNIA